MRFIASKIEGGSIISENKMKWVGYCPECCKWRHTGMTLTHVITKEKRCAKCTSRLMIKCKVCNGNGTTQALEEGTYCSFCGGHKVVLQEPVPDLEED